jgi:pyridoxine 5-phosphate synthase
LNLEMAATDEMLAIALAHKPHACCLVPEKREEKTTEGGLDVAAGHRHLAPFVRSLEEAGIRTSLFIDPEPVQVVVAKALGASVIELHTGAYCEAVLAGHMDQAAHELKRLHTASEHAIYQGLELHAGHGLTFETVGAIVTLPEVKELNIGHFMMGEALFCGLTAVLYEMRRRMDEALSVHYAPLSF